MATNEIFARMLDYLYANHYVVHQADLASKTGVNTVSISRILNGRVKNTKQETLRKVNAAFGGIFNPAFLRGESDVMLVADLHEQDKINASANLYNHNCITRNQGVTSQDTISMMNTVIAAKDEVIAALRNQLADKDALIESKERYINILQQQILDLRNPKKVLG